MSLQNQFTISGRLGRDAETKFTSSGIAVSTLNVAVEERIKKGEQWEKVTQWFRVTLWRKEKLVEYLKKGAVITVSGHLQNREWEKDGEKRYATDLVGEEVLIHSSARHEEAVVSAPRSAKAAPAPAAAQPDPLPFVATDDDVPF